MWDSAQKSENYYVYDVRFGSKAGIKLTTPEAGQCVVNLMSAISQKRT